MACMTHECNECGAMWHDNKTHSKCPKCGSDDVYSEYDE